MEEEEKIKVERKEEEKLPPSGLRVTRAREAEVPPPLLEEEIAEVPPEVRVAAIGKIPISPAVVKPLLRFEGIALAETTNFSGFLYTEEDLENIAELVQQCGLQATPMLQLFLALGGMHAERGFAYFAWRKGGKPEGMKYHKGED